MNNDIVSNTLADTQNDMDISQSTVPNLEFLGKPKSKNSPIWHIKHAGQNYTQYSMYGLHCNFTHFVNLLRILMFDIYDMFSQYYFLFLNNKTQIINSIIKQKMLHQNEIFLFFYFIT